MSAVDLEVEMLFDAAATAAMVFVVGLVLWSGHSLRVSRVLDCLSVPRFVQDNLTIHL